MADKTVTLIDQLGGEVSVTTPADINNLVFGAGYKIKGNKTVHEALAYVADQGVDPAVQAAPEKPTK